MAEENKNNLVEQDLFINDFVHYKTISIRDAKDKDVFRSYKFGIKEISGFEEDKIGKQVTNVNERTGKVSVDQAEANVKYLKAVLVEAPFSVTEANIRKLSSKIKGELLNFAREVNSVSDETEKK